MTQLASPPPAVKQFSLSPADILVICAFDHFPQTIIWAYFMLGLVEMSRSKTSQKRTLVLDDVTPGTCTAVYKPFSHLPFRRIPTPQLRQAMSRPDLFRMISGDSRTQWPDLQPPPFPCIAFPVCPIVAVGVVHKTPLLPLSLASLCASSCDSQSVPETSSA